MTKFFDKIITSLVLIGLASAVYAAEATNKCILTVEHPGETTEVREFCINGKIYLQFVEYFDEKVQMAVITTDKPCKCINFYSPKEHNSSMKNTISSED